MKIALFSDEQETFAECKILKITFSNLYISVPELIMYPNYGEHSYNTILYNIIMEAKRLNYKSVYMIIKNSPVVRLAAELHFDISGSIIFFV